MTAQVTVWIPWHQTTPLCWCRPRSDGDLLIHRRLPVLPDREARAFVLLIRGVPA